MVGWAIWCTYEMEAFMDAYRGGDAEPEDIDMWIERWHAGEGATQALHEYLGMTRTQYARWVETGELP